MNGIFNPIIFYPSAILMILFAILTIKFRNIFYSLISAIVVFFIAGMFFYLLGSEYNAVIQIAIYGVAIPVILAIAIMFTDMRRNTKTEAKSSNLKYIMFLIGGLFILALIYLVMTSLVINPVGFDVDKNIENTSLQVMAAFGYGIFVRYVWAFELLSIILTLIVLGLVMINTNKEEE